LPFVIPCLTVDANSLDELNSLVDEAVDILFECLIEDGDFDQFMRDRGWTKKERQAAAPAPRVHLPRNFVFEEMPNEETCAHAC